MRVATPTQAPTPTPPSEPPYPWRVGLVMVALVLVLGAAFFFATQVLNGPAIDDRPVAPTETAIALEVAATSAAMPTRAPTTQAAAQPQTLPATAAPTAAATPTASGCPGCRTNSSADRSQRLSPTAAPTAFTGDPRAAPIPLSGPISIDDPAAGQAVLDAYLNYFQVSGQALYNLDPAPLDAVAADRELQGLTNSIAQDRQQGRALKTDVKHNALVVRVEGDDAELVDTYDDSSIWVDPTTKQPLPGEVAPASPDVAPVVSIKYQLHRFDGVWKVVGGTRYTCTGSTAPECAGKTG